MINSEKIIDYALVTIIIILILYIIYIYLFDYDHTVLLMSDSEKATRIQQLEKRVKILEMINEN